MKRNLILGALLVSPFSYATSIPITAEGVIPVNCVVEQAVGKLDLVATTESLDDSRKYTVYVSSNADTAPTYTISYVSTNLKRKDGSSAVLGQDIGFSVDGSTLVEGESVNTMELVNGRYQASFWALVNPDGEYKPNSKITLAGSTTINCPQ